MSPARTLVSMRLMGCLAEPALPHRALLTGRTGRGVLSVVRDIPLVAQRASPVPVHEAIMSIALAASRAAFATVLSA
jgi:hypothetical protein